MKAEKLLDFFKFKEVNTPADIPTTNFTLVNLFLFLLVAKYLENCSIGLLELSIDIIEALIYFHLPKSSDTRLFIKANLN